MQTGQQHFHPGFAHVVVFDCGDNKVGFDLVVISSVDLKCRKERFNSRFSGKDFALSDASFHHFRGAVANSGVFAVPFKPRRNEARSAISDSERSRGSRTFS